MSWDDFLEEIRYFECERAFEILSRMEIFLAHEGFSKPEVQNALCEDFISSDYTRRVNDLDKTQGWSSIIFTQQAILNLKKLFLRYGVSGGSMIESTEDKLRFGRLVLTINDYIDNKPEQNEYLKEKPQLASMTIRNLLFNRRTQPRYSMPRCWDMYVALPSQVSTRTTFDMAATFMQATGLSIPEFLAIGFAFLGRWIGFNVTNLWTEHLGINHGTYFANTKIPQDKIKLALDEMCATWEEHVNAIPEDIRSEPQWEYRFKFAQRKPLVKLPSGLIAPFSLDFAVEKITANIYYTILNYVSPDDRKVNDFTSHYGEIFEAYIYRTIERMYPSEVKKVYYPNNEELGDALLPLDDWFFIFEFKTSRFLYEVRVTGDLEAFRKNLEKNLLKAAEQVERVIQIVSSGDVDEKIGIDHRKIQRFQPVFVFEDEFPQDFLTWEFYESIIPTESILRDPKVAKRPLLLTCEELEVLEAIVQNGHSLKELILRKENNVTWNNTDFFNFLYDGVFKDAEVINNNLLQKYLTVQGVIKKILFG